jgi:hypothetical protein
MRTPRQDDGQRQVGIARDEGRGGRRDLHEAADVVAADAAAGTDDGDLLQHRRFEDQEPERLAIVGAAVVDLLGLRLAERQGRAGDRILHPLQNHRRPEVDMGLEAAAEPCFGSQIGGKGQSHDQDRGHQPDQASLSRDRAHAHPIACHATAVHQPRSRKIFSSLGGDA